LKWWGSKSLIQAKIPLRDSSITSILYHCYLRQILTTGKVGVTAKQISEHCLGHPLKISTPRPSLAAKTQPESYTPPQEAPKNKQKTRMGKGRRRRKIRGNKSSLTPIREVSYENPLDSRFCSKWESNPMYYGVYARLPGSPLLRSFDLTTLTKAPATH
jgi:hypothetical protein